MNKILGLLAIIAVAGGAYVLLATTPSAPPDHALKIGVILPLTGDSAVTGEKLRQGVELAKKDLGGSRVEFVVEDSHSSARDAVSAAAKLFGIDAVDVIIGTYVPDETIAVAPLAAAEGKDVFSFSFCSDSFKTLENVFCGYPNARKQLDTVLPLIKKKGVKTLAIADSNSDFGMQSRDAMTADAPTSGYKVIYNDLLPNTKDYRTLATKILASKADALFTATDNPADALTLVKQLRDLGFTGTAITFIDVDNKNTAAFGSAAEATFAPGIAPSQFSPAFTALYRTAYGADPDYVSALGYDMARYVVQAMRANPALQAKDAVLKYAYKSPAISNFRFLSDRTVQYDLELQMVKDGRYVRAQY